MAGRKPRLKQSTTSKKVEAKIATSNLRLRVAIFSSYDMMRQASNSNSVRVSVVANLEEGQLMHAKSVYYD